MNYQNVIYFQRENQYQEISTTNLGGGLSIKDLKLQENTIADPPLVPHKQDDIKTKEQYDNFFQEVQAEIADFSIQKINKNKEKLDYHNIKILSSNDGYMKLLIRKSENYVQFKSQKHGGTHCIYDVIIGRFYLTISVLHLHRFSGQCYTQIQKANKGSYGVVREVNLSEKKIAVKKIRYQKNGSQNSSSKNPVDEFDEAKKEKIQGAIREYCLYKISSMLEIGPKVIFNDIYDIICYNDCVQFHMELCQISTKATQKTYRKDLKACLRKLHSLKFIHKDIKLQNIVYSQSLNQYVLIDFGFTQAVGENVWEKTETYFQGTPNYASEQLLALKDRKGKVNLYKNDIFALNKTFEELDNNMNPKGNFANSFDQNNYCQSQDLSSWSMSESQSRNIEEDHRNITNNSSYYSQNSTRSVGNAFEDNPTVVNFYVMKSIYAILMKNNLQKMRIKEKQELIDNTIEKICKCQGKKNLTSTVKNFVNDIFQQSLDIRMILLQNKVRIYSLHSEQVGYFLQEYLNSVKESDENSIKNQTKEKLTELLKKINQNKPQKIIQSLKKKEQQNTIHRKLFNHSCMIKNLKKMLKQYEMINENKQNYEKLILETYIYLKPTKDINIQDDQEISEKITKIVQNRINKDQKYKEYALMDAIKQRILTKGWTSSQNFLHLGEIFVELNRSKVTKKLLNTLQQIYNGVTNELNEPSQIQINYAFYRFYFLIGDFVEAQKRVRKYLKIIQESESFKISHSAFIAKDHLGRMLMEKDQYDEALKVLDESYELKKQILFPQKIGKQIAIYHLYKGIIYCSKQMYEESIEQFEECLDKLVDKNVNKNLIYETYNDLAHVYEKVKNYDKMIQILQIMVEMSRKIHYVNIEKLNLGLQNLFFYKLFLKKLSKSQIREYVKELVQLKLKVKENRITIFRVQYLNMFCIKKWKNKLQPNDQEQVNLGQTIMLQFIEPLLPDFRINYLQICQSILMYYLKVQKKQKSLTYQWKYLVHSPKANLSKSTYNNLLQLVKFLMRGRHFRKARNLLKKYIDLIPQEFKDERRKSYELSYQINSDLNSIQSYFYTLVWNQKAYSNEECYNNCLNTIKSKIKCPYRRLILQKRLKKIKYIQSQGENIHNQRLFSGEEENRKRQQMKEGQMKKTKVQIKSFKEYMDFFERFKAEKKTN